MKELVVALITRVRVSEQYDITKQAEYAAEMAYDEFVRDLTPTLEIYDDTAVKPNPTLALEYHLTPVSLKAKVRIIKRHEVKVQ